MKYSKVIILILIIGGLIALFLNFGLKYITLPFLNSGTNKNLTPPASVVIPTNTPEEVEVISKIKTYSVSVETNILKPKLITVKLNDQVQFVNDTTKEIIVSGEGWGGVALKPGENMTQAFEKPGTFPYTVTGTVQPLKGQVTVE